MRAESPEWLCRHSLVPIPPQAAASRTGGSCWWDLELNISFCGCKLIPAQDLSTSVFQLVASKVDGVQDGVGMAAERLGHPLHKVTVGRRVTRLSKVWTPPGNTATSPVALDCATRLPRPCSSLPCNTFTYAFNPLFSSTSSSKVTDLLSM